GVSSPWEHQLVGKGTCKAGVRRQLDILGTLREPPTGGAAPSARARAPGNCCSPVTYEAGPEQ
ncbi:MAG: hypothetical protein ACP5VR_13315, partial [Acidimicrobiales bacterium]